MSTFLLCEEDRDRYEELVDIKEDALGNVKEEDKKGERVERSLI